MAAPPATVCSAMATACHRRGPQYRSSVTAATSSWVRSGVLPDSRSATPKSRSASRRWAIHVSGSGFSASHHSWSCISAGAVCRPWLAISPHRKGGTDARSDAFEPLAGRLSSCARTTMRSDSGRPCSRKGNGWGSCQVPGARCTRWMRSRRPPPIFANGTAQPARGRSEAPVTSELLVGVRVRAPQPAGLEPGDRVHLGGAELEPEDVEVLPLAVPIARLRDRDAAELDVPAQHDLRRRDAMRLRRSTHRLRLEHVRALAERAPALGADAELLVHRTEGRLREEGVQLHLIHRGHDTRLPGNPA